LREIFDSTRWKLDGLLCGLDTLPTLHGITLRNLGSKEKRKGILGVPRGLLPSREGGPGGAGNNHHLDEKGNPRQSSREEVERSESFSLY